MLILTCVPLIVFFLASFACSIVGRLKSMTLSLLPGTAGIVVNLYILEEQHVEFIERLLMQPITLAFNNILNDYSVSAYSLCRDD